MRVAGRNMSRESWVTLVGTVAGVIGALAAVAVFFVRTADARDHAAPTTATTATTRATVPETSSGSTASEPVSADATATRYLATLVPATGVGSFRREGDDLLVACPTNQTGDRYRELRYDLLAPYSRLAAAVAVAGPGDPDATAGVQVFIQRRRDRSDRVEEVGRSVVRPGETRQLDVAIDDAAAVVLRVSCAVPDQTVRLTGPRISR
jgi:hypothetical protein